MAGEYLITPGVAIQQSPYNRSWLFFESSPIHAHLGANERAFLSSLPDGDGPIIIDNGVLVNGRRFDNTFAGTLGDPMQNLGRGAEVAYRAVEAIDITAEARADHQWWFQLLDYGYTFAASRLYLVIK